MGSEHTSKGTVVQIRCSEAERAEWQTAADAVGLTLSAWIRSVAHVAARKAKR